MRIPDTLSELPFNQLEHLLNKPILVLGEKRTLREWYIKGSKWETTIEKYLKGRFLADWLNDQEYVVVSDPVPSPPIYYVERSLISISSSKPRPIDIGAFHHETQGGRLHDAFVFKEISRVELSMLARGSGFGTSYACRQIECVTEKFILFDTEDNFQALCKSSKNISIHLVTLKSGSFFLEKTHGVTTNIDGFLKDSHQETSEDLFIKALSNDSKPICISDTAGMGKTWLLASLSRKMKQMYSDRVVLFILLSDLISEYLKRQFPVETTTKFILSLLASQISHDGFGQEIVYDILKNDQRKIELFLDGYDEIKVEELGTAQCLLTNIIYKFKHIRLFVTTRPHKCDQLQKPLQTNAVNILPFSKPDQIEFLTKYWHNKIKVISMDEFTGFANTVIDILDVNMKDLERDIAGIPLQCMLLADSYFETAVQYVRNAKNCPFQMKVDPKPLSYMFKEHMDLRFSKPNEHAKEIRDLHVFHAAKLLFPEWLDRLETMIINKDSLHVEINDLFELGIIEMIGGKTWQPKFVHRTFAEYLLAEFLSGTVQTKILKHERNTMLSFIFGTVLDTDKEEEKQDIHNVLKNELVIYKFRNPVLCYFYNFHVISFNNNAALILVNAYMHDQPNLFNCHTFHKILSACCYHQHTNLITQLQQLFLYDLNLLADNLELLHSNILAVAAQHDNKQLLLLVYDICKKLKEKCFDVDKMQRMCFSKSMISAVSKGNYTGVEFLMDKFRDYQDSLYCILHHCVAETKNETSSVINEKRDIICYVTSVYPRFLNEKDLVDERTPLLMNEIHVDLLKYLIEIGADIYAVTKSTKSTFLHQATSYLPPFELHDIFQEILKFDNGKLLKQCDIENLTPVQYALTKELLPDTLELLLNWVQQFGSTDLIVGDENCNFNDLVSTILDTSTRSMLIDGWKDLSRKLNIPVEVKNLKVNDILHNKSSYKDAIEHIFIAWKAKESGKATLNQLVSIMRDLKWNEMADKLENDFRRTKKKILEDAIMKFQKKSQKI